MSQENVEIVRGAYELYVKRAVDPYRAHFADDFKFHTQPGFPSQAVYGIDDMQTLWADLDETFTDYSVVPTDFVGVGDYVIVTLQTSTRMKGSRARIEETIYHLWHVRGGKVLEAWAHSEREAALEAAGLQQ